MSPKPDDERNVPPAQGREETSTPSHLPPRMRERMEARERRAGRPAGGGLGLTLLILLLLAAAGGFVWWHTYDSANNTVSRDETQPTAAVPDMTDASYGVSVGSFPSEEAAIGERDRLTGVTHLPVSVGQVNAGGALQFQVILGSYTSRADAESVGRSLEQSSIVKDWHVVPLGQSM